VYCLPMTIDESIKINAGLQPKIVCFASTCKFANTTSTSTSVISGKEGACTSTSTRSRPFSSFRRRQKGKMDRKNDRGGDRTEEHDKRRLRGFAKLCPPTAPTKPSARARRPIARQLIRSRVEFTARMWCLVPRQFSLRSQRKAIKNCSACLCTQPRAHNQLSFLAKAAKLAQESVCRSVQGDLCALADTWGKTSVHAVLNSLGCLQQQTRLAGITQFSKKIGRTMRQIKAVASAAERASASEDDGENTDKDDWLRVWSRAS
jgi:hypothetical protein